MGYEKKKKKKINNFKKFGFLITNVSNLTKNCDKIRTLVSNGIQEMTKRLNVVVSASAAGVI